MVYKILQLPHPILRKKLPDLKKTDKKFLDFLKNFQETLEKQQNPEGLGLSANQVGKEYRMFLGRIGKKEIRLFINPEILEFSDERVVMTEGCLSIKNLYSKIERPKQIKLRYQSLNIRENQLEIGVNPEGKLANRLSAEIVETFEGLPARVMQHEVDHLNGVVFIDHALRQKAPIFRLIKHKNGEDEFVEVNI
jgi:peptide deformylase